MLQSKLIAQILQTGTRPQFAIYIVIGRFYSGIMTQEQNEAICNMREKAAIWMSKMQACYFFEERLGKMHKHTIDFRLSLSEDLEKYRDAQIACDDCGATDELMKLI